MNDYSREIIRKIATGEMDKEAGSVQLPTNGTHNPLIDRYVSNVSAAEEAKANSQSGSGVSQQR